MIIYKRGIYELPHDLPHDLKLNKLGNIKKTLKTPQNDSLMPNLPAKIKVLLILEKKRS